MSKKDPISLSEFDAIVCICLMYLVVENSIVTPVANIHGDPYTTIAVTLTTICHWGHYKVVECCKFVLHHAWGGVHIHHHSYN